MIEHLAWPLEARIDERLQQEERSTKAQRFPPLRERPAPLARLDDNGSIGDQCHRPIAPREVSTRHRATRRELGDDQVFGRDLPLERRICCGEHLVQGGPDDGDGPTALRHRFRVRDRVDALRETAHDDRAFGDDRLHEPSSSPDTLGGWVPRPHDGDAEMTLEQ